ncbi:ectoine/hydroxyectoine ABC transporter substrate-binding protein EhuB [Paracoccus sp. MKU1]|uniref:ectoine/hydroxyectoine ABC transporter substrate-binding protein EhuB n=1 Tax=Paracoccus sp. MKU1 TaxID=1745182 RepID=UPI0007192E13|nr:ectoine/hydroxyectoine ABC transporter substrate-binding protein EhuB [Paracoccus sp. MKU1]KRW96014.1 hypothetical protein AQY21_11475 [Paracoccus sp. MKU1]
MFAIRSLGACALTAALALTGLSGNEARADQLEDLVSRGEVTVALAHEPPYTDYQGSGAVGGAAPTLLMRIMSELGVEKIKPQLMEFAALIPSLQAGRADVISTGLYINPERCKAILFSEPDLCVSEGFAVVAGNPKKIQGLADIAADGGITYGVCSGCSAERRAVEMGVPRDRIITVPDHQNGIKMLIDGRVDVYAAPDLALRATVKNMGLDNVEVVEAQGEPVKCSGVGFRRGAETLRDAFDAKLKALKESGEYDKIVSEYGFNPEFAKTVTREQLCSVGG